MTAQGKPVETSERLDRKAGHLEIAQRLEMQVEPCLICMVSARVMRRSSKPTASCWVRRY